MSISMPSGSFERGYSHDKISIKEYCEMEKRYKSELAEKVEEIALLKRMYVELTGENPPKRHKVDEYCVGCKRLIALGGTNPVCALDRKCKDFEE